MSTLNNKLEWNFCQKDKQIFFGKTCSNFENVVYQMEAILFIPQYMRDSMTTKPWLPWVSVQLQMTSLTNKFYLYFALQGKKDNPHLKKNLMFYKNEIPSHPNGKYHSVLQFINLTSLCILKKLTLCAESLCMIIGICYIYQHCKAVFTFVLKEARNWLVYTVNIMAVDDLAT